MKTDFADFIRDTDEGRIADSILGKCVHCGFCTATCPTYRLLGNELDGPRGRIYLIKQALEGNELSGRTQLHLDRCLTCRSCETTCPSGVRYSRLLEIGRQVVDERVGRKPWTRLYRRILCIVVPRPGLFGPLLQAARALGWAMPSRVRAKLSPGERPRPWVRSSHERKVVLHQGCVQRVVKPAINEAAARYLEAQSISAVRAADVCCGAVGLHNGDREGALKMARKNIDAWWDEIENGAEAIISTASGCGITIKEYGELLESDPAYASKAKAIASMAKDLSEFDERAGQAAAQGNSGVRVAFHNPCTLQHGQRIVGKVESILRRNGFETTQVPGSHLCCGSAGTYSLLQPELSDRLLDDKIQCLMDGNPAEIATANIGCLMHLQSKSGIPVRHWVELVAPE